MRFIWYIAIAVVLWYLGKAVMRHYLSGNEGRKRQVTRRVPEERRDSPSGAIPYEKVRDANYRDVE